MDIGWVGLGSIGTAMVMRLRASGQSVSVYPRGDGVAAVAAAGATRRDDYVALARGSDVLVVCVYTDTQVREVLFDAGALAALRPASTLVIHTTGAPALAREIGARAPAGVAVLDATFSGGTADIEAGRLTIMAGGEAAALDRALPVLQAYAREVHHVGPLGHGQTVKLLNNLLFATNLMNAVELLRLAGAVEGLEPSIVASVLQSCSGASYAMTLLRSAGALETTVRAARPYLEKDVATVVTTAHEAGLDISHFAGTADYFRSEA